MRKIRKNDTVRVIAGKEKGKVGKVLAVVEGGKRVTIEKINIVKRHTKPSTRNQMGGIVDKEAPLAISNVALAASDGQPVRVSFKVQDADGAAARKVRYSRKLDRVLD